MSLSHKIVQVANSYLGQEEISGNKGFKNTAFQKKMQECGWQIGQSWCAYFSELVWKEAFGKSHPLYNTLDRLFSPSAVSTYSNFKGYPNGFKAGSTPKIGSLAVWRLGNGWQGHIGIVTEIVDKNTFKSVEGNTNAAGGREGIQVARKVRVTNMPFRSKGLNLIGFIYPE
jgi:hypothetical protein